MLAARRTRLHRGVSVWPHRAFNERAYEMACGNSPAENALLVGAALRRCRNASPPPNLRCDRLISHQFDCFRAAPQLAFSVATRVINNVADQRNPQRAMSYSHVHPPIDDPYPQTHPHNPQKFTAGPGSAVGDRSRAAGTVGRRRVTRWCWRGDRRCWP
jgi:hypothetical protein